MITRQWVNPVCFTCDRRAFKFRVTDNRLVCRDHEYTFPEGLTSGDFK